MKIKYFDKNHESIKETAQIVGTVLGFIAVSSITIGSFFYWAGQTTPRMHEISNITYVHGTQKFDCDDIYILYKEQEIRKCTKKGYIKSGGIICNDYNYEFFDIETGENLGYVDIDRNEGVTSKGYKYINLANYIYEDKLEKKTSDISDINQEYLDDVIENKRFLGR